MSQTKGAVNRRFLAAFLALAMSFAPVYSADLSQAASALGFGPPVIAPSAIIIPEELGKIEEIFQGRSNKLVVYIQDAHANYSAQKNIASIIDRMATDYGIDLVSAEGAEGEIDTSLFRTFPIPEITEEVLDRHMRAGEIGGPEYIATVGEREIDFVGVDRHELYVKNLAEFNAVLDIRESGLEFIKKVETAFRNLRNTVYSKEHKELDRVIEKYRSEAMDWMMFIGELRKYASGLKVEVDEKSYGHLSVLFHLTDALEKNDVSEADVKQKFESIDAQSLFSDVERLTLTLKLKLAQSDTELQLIRCERYIFLLKRGLELSLTRDEAIELEELAKKISRDDLMSFLKGTAAQNRLRVDYLTSVENISIDEYAERILSFYRTTTKRDEQFLKLLKREMEGRRKQSALLVTGGFHREGVTKRLRKAGISYAVILPHIDEISSHDEYLDIMRKQAELFHIPSRNTLAPDIARGVSNYLITRGETGLLLDEARNRWDDSDMAALRTEHGVVTEMDFMQKYAEGEAVMFYERPDRTGWQPLYVPAYRQFGIRRGVSGQRRLRDSTSKILVDAIGIASVGTPIQAKDSVSVASSRGIIRLISPAGVAPIRGVGFGSAQEDQPELGPASDGGDLLSRYDDLFYFDKSADLRANSDLLDKILAPDFKATFDEIIPKGGFAASMPDFSELIRTMDSPEMRFLAVEPEPLDLTKWKHLFFDPPKFDFQAFQKIELTKGLQANFLMMRIEDALAGETGIKGMAKRAAFQTARAGIRLIASIDDQRMEHERADTIRLRSAQLLAKWFGVDSKTLSAAGFGVSRPGKVASLIAGISLACLSGGCGIQTITPPSGTTGTPDVGQVEPQDALQTAINQAIGDATPARTFTPTTDPRHAIDVFIHPGVSLTQEQIGEISLGLSAAGTVEKYEVTKRFIFIPTGAYPDAALTFPEDGTIVIQVSDEGIVTPNGQSVAGMTVDVVDQLWHEALRNHQIVSRTAQTDFTLTEAINLAYVHLPFEIPLEGGGRSFVYIHPDAGIGEEDRDAIIEAIETEDRYRGQPFVVIIPNMANFPQVTTYESNALVLQASVVEELLAVKDILQSNGIPTEARLFYTDSRDPAIRIPVYDFYDNPSNQFSDEEIQGMFRKLKNLQVEDVRLVKFVGAVLLSNLPTDFSAFALRDIDGILVVIDDSEDVTTAKTAGRPIYSLRHLAEERQPISKKTALEKTRGYNRLPYIVGHEVGHIFFFNAGKLLQETIAATYQSSYGDSANFMSIHSGNNVDEYAAELFGSWIAETFDGFSLFQAMLQRYRPDRPFLIQGVLAMATHFAHPGDRQTITLYQSDGKGDSTPVEFALEKSATRVTMGPLHLLLNAEGLITAWRFEHPSTGEVSEGIFAAPFNLPEVWNAVPSVPDTSLKPLPPVTVLKYTQEPGDTVSALFASPDWRVTYNRTQNVLLATNAHTGQQTTYNVSGLFVNNVTVLSTGEIIAHVWQALDLEPFGLDFPPDVSKNWLERILLGRGALPYLARFSSGSISLVPFSFSGPQTFVGMSYEMPAPFDLTGYFVAPPTVSAAEDGNAVLVTDSDTGASRTVPLEAFESGRADDPPPELVAFSLGNRNGGVYDTWQDVLETYPSIATNPALAEIREIFHSIPDKFVDAPSREYHVVTAPDGRIGIAQVLRGDFDLDPDVYDYDNYSRVVIVTPSGDVQQHLYHPAPAEDISYNSYALVLSLDVSEDGAFVVEYYDLRPLRWYGWTAYDVIDAQGQITSFIGVPFWVPEGTPEATDGSGFGAEGGISTEDMRRKLNELEKHMPGQKPVVYKFGEFLSGRLSPANIVPDGFIIAAEKTLYDLQEGVDGFSGQPIQSSLVDYPAQGYAVLRRLVPEIAKAVAPEDFAEGVRKVWEEINEGAGFGAMREVRRDISTLELSTDFDTGAEGFAFLDEIGALKFKPGKTTMEFITRVGKLTDRGEAIQAKSTQPGITITQEELGQFIVDVRSLIAEFFIQSDKVEKTFVRLVTLSQPALSSKPSDRDLNIFRGESAQRWTVVLNDLRTAVEKAGFGAAENYRLWHSQVESTHRALGALQEDMQSGVDSDTAGFGISVAPVVTKENAVDQFATGFGFTQTNAMIAEDIRGLQEKGIGASYDTLLADPESLLSADAALQQVFANVERIIPVGFTALNVEKREQVREAVERVWGKGKLVYDLEGIQEALRGLKLRHAPVPLIHPEWQLKQEVKDDLNSIQDAQAKQFVMAELFGAFSDLVQDMVARNRIVAVMA